MTRFRLLFLVLLLSTVAVAVSAAGCGLAAPLSDENNGTISINNLPIEALDTIELIRNGGPFSYKQDNSVFNNREGLLPQKPGGYYHEYTVKTPGSPDRGARRIIKGNGGELYYTDDHYASFQRIVE